MNQHEAMTKNTGNNRYFVDFSAALRYWRDKRGYSQLRLSTESSTSQRHISFLESGRSQPSREMVLKLGIALDIPLRERNGMLLAAGYAPAYRERSLSDPELASVKQALDFMLTQQTPYPALVVDRLWNLVMTNASAAMLIRWLLDMPNDMPLPHDGVNVLKLMLDPNGIRKHLQNWREVCTDLLQWIQREALGDGPGSEAATLLGELLALPGVATVTRLPNLDTLALPFLPMQIRKDNISLNLFTSIATMGTPHDVTVHELRIESFFPADEVTAEWFKARS
ncbi:helix-turn-helix domain-containing protein [Pusillimonas sp. ANT_WB101]|uniref:helix-turn-helix domain-containing protein n=1 Tax=Pusillimonas sp. ANT_WB101 TaxID=2597356 RepID=UPI0011EE0E3B|nr:helix-turn-helix domain-containing protein [Pusillimonas sp. ANT_WB101]KAA0893104.1 helix-turn-helix domain-containing protein [Pusillimonas sp. ANT_WB101]